MTTLKCIFSICTQNFRKWQTDYRVWSIALLLVVMTSICSDEFKSVDEILGAGFPVWIFPFLYSQFYTKLVYLLPVVLLFCSAPFTDRNQTFVFMRAGKIKWLCGQILYIVLASAVYFLFLLVVSVLLSAINGGNFADEWGKTLATISANPSFAIEKADATTLFVSAIILTFFKPLQAIGFTLLMSWLGGVFIGLTIFLCNILTGNKLIGVLVSSVLVVISCAVENDLLEPLMPFSPISWTTLDNIDVGGFTSNPSFAYCVTVYAILLVLLIAAILIFGKKKNLDIKE